MNTITQTAPVTDFAALHDALGCAAMAAVQAWRGDRDSASLSLAEAHAAAEEAFGPRSPEIDALGVVFGAIAQAARNMPAGHPRNEIGPPRCANTVTGPDQSRLRQERSMPNPTMASPPVARSLLDICTDARRAWCGQCQAPAGIPCVLGTTGDHVARFAAAHRCGLISGPDFTAVTDAATVFCNATIIFAGAS